MTDLYLRAESEDDLAAALPMLRGTAEDGSEVWITGSAHHALDSGIPIVVTPAVQGEDGEVEEPAILDEHFHANLRLLDGHPDWDAILAASELFRVEPAASQRVFAGEPPRPVVPETISDRQFAQALALAGTTTQAEALAWAARGELPQAMEDALDQIPDTDGQRFGARMMLAAATTYERRHPLSEQLGALLGYDAGALDALWTRAAAL